METIQKSEILSISFNQDKSNNFSFNSGAFSVGTETGFKIYATYPLKLSGDRDNISLIKKWVEA